MVPGDVNAAGAGAGSTVGMGEAGSGPTGPLNMGTTGGGFGLAATCDASLPGQPALRRLNRRELEATVRDVFPVLGADWRSTLSADTVSELGFDNDNAQLVVSRQTARELSSTADSVGELVAANVASVLPCATATPDESCVRTFLATSGQRLFRRPLETAEVDQFVEFFNTAEAATGSFAGGIGWVTRALVESPVFVYRREIGALQGGVYRLNAYEVATELAYTFTGTGPSEALLARAAAGELSSPEELESTARDLLLTAGEGVIQNFFDSYVGHSRVTSIAKAGVQGFAELRPAMLQETRDFIREILITREEGIRELLTANFTIPSPELSTAYGLPAPEEPGALVLRNPGEGIGLLAQASVLSTLAQPDGSSPTKRGLWVFEKLLCNTVPSPPADIPELGEPEPGVRTTRQRYEEDHAQGFCASCHTQWDPIGFGFEHFDEAGRYRENEGGSTIDAKSYVPYLGETLFEFDGQEDLVRQLSEEPLIHQCLSGYLTAYAFGEPVSCSGETKRGQFVDGSIGVVDYLASLAAEPHFSERVLGEE